MSKIQYWRKTNKSWVNGKIFLNISNIYKVNDIVGYSVDLYDISKGGTLNEQRRRLKSFRTKNEALQFVGMYMRTHPNGKEVIQ